VHDLAVTGPGTAGAAAGAAEARTAADADAGPTAADRTSAAPAGPPAAWDLVVVDLPPVPEAPAVLALPEQLGRYLRRLLPPQRQAARALRPVLAQLAGVPMPSPWLYETSARWQDELAAAQAVIAAGTTTLLLVVEPGPAGSDALRRIRPGLALHGHRVEAVVANRLLPTGSTDPWLTALSGRQQSALKSLHEDWGPGTDVLELPHLGHDPRGTTDLAPLADALGRAPVGPGGATPWPVEDLRDGEGVLVWRIPLPGAARDDLGLVRLGDELVLRVGPFRRIVPLPSALRRCAVSGAGLTDGELRVRFTPDPALWPRTP
jgi:arsenite-transporting ATPase